MRHQPGQIQAFSFAGRLDSIQNASHRWTLRRRRGPRRCSDGGRRRSARQGSAVRGSGMSCPATQTGAAVRRVQRNGRSRAPPPEGPAHRASATTARTRTGVLVRPAAPRSRRRPAGHVRPLRVVDGAAETRIRPRRCKTRAPTRTPSAPSDLPARARALFRPPTARRAAARPAQVPPRAAAAVDPRL
jgi:hypothetical protein